ncbi:DUF6087 family protein [Streptomyces sp. NPDC032161]|uniref:DUF6087 family protein n=1 Tax=unclassified Streptomyces TaxID=2593676 RepID=UPI0033D40FF0
MHGGASHLSPDEPRALEVWDGFAYIPAGTTENLPAAQAWANRRTRPAFAEAADGAVC